MSIVFSKKDNNTIIVTETEEAKELPAVEHTYEFLLSQRANIIKQANEYAEARKKELAEVDALIVEADKLGITKKVNDIEILP